eukprot:sb/3475319/
MKDEEESGEDESGEDEEEDGFRKSYQYDENRSGGFRKSYQYDENRQGEHTSPRELPVGLVVGSSRTSSATPGNQEEVEEEEEEEDERGETKANTVEPNTIDNSHIQVNNSVHILADSSAKITKSELEI